MHIAFVPAERYSKTFEQELVQSGIFKNIFETNFSFKLAI